MITSLHENLKSLGESKTTYENTYNPSLLEWFPNPQQEVQYEINIEAKEISNLCPKTGQPDFATFVIQYYPAERCIESKSLKLYFFSYRQEGIFHEAMVNRVARDLFDLLQPWSITVEGRFNARGGITFWPKVTLAKENPQQNLGDLA